MFFITISRRASLNYEIYVSRAVAHASKSKTKVSYANFQFENGLLKFAYFLS